MNRAEAIAAARATCRIRRLSRHTEDTYTGWISRFCEHAKRHPDLSREERIRTYLEDLAPRTAASTQNQALNALVFFYRDVLREPLGDLGKWARAKRPQRLPTWLCPQQMQRLLDHMPPNTRLMAQVAYGSGLRIAELLALRVKDIDLHHLTVTVRGGKGDKDRVTCLAESLLPTLEAHLQHVRTLWQSDRTHNRPAIYLPDCLERKFPHAGQEWPWFWIWPAANESRDPRSHITRRHHLHEDTLGKALRTAASKAGLHQRVTAHTLRHSFATAMLSGGHSISEVQELLGHSSVETTQVYLHCLPHVGRRVSSPLDQPQPAASNVLPFGPVQAGTATRARQA